MPIAGKPKSGLYPRIQTDFFARSGQHDALSKKGDARRRIGRPQDLAKAPA
jgi:hypothetical protein